MRIERIQVEDGFLSGLDLAFQPGLNVIIGARGTGKTSIIELLRFALNARSHTTETAVESLSHVRSILNEGSVSVVVTTEEGSVEVTRAAQDPEPRATGVFAKPIIFSQKEIESIGLTDSGRLKLLDGFVSGRNETLRREDAVVAAIRSLQREIETRAREVDALAEDLPKLPTLREQLAAAHQRQNAQQGMSTELAAKQGELARLTADQTAQSVSESTLARFTKLLEDWSAAFASVTSIASVEAAPTDRPDPLAPFRDRLTEVRDQTARSLQTIQEIRDEAMQAMTALVRTKLEAETRSRALRSEADVLAEGAGAIARDIATLQAKVAELESVNAVVGARRAEIAERRARRDALLVDLDRNREDRYAARLAAAERINQNLNPRIRVEVERYAQYGDYSRAIVDALRGSNLKYNELSTAIVEALSPSELLKLIEARDFDGLALAVNIPRDRASRVVNALADAGLGEIAVCDVEDDARFSLLDGPDYKDIADLSAGQRCTVILPIVLQHDERALIIDQPEDHIDNAFIADTLIQALRARASQSQLIVSTHNANIPVLGEAALVVEMVSDGRQGTVQVCQPLEHPDAVHAITTVMEGGEAAFENRARFYADHHA